MFRGYLTTDARRFSAIITAQQTRESLSNVAQRSCRAREGVPHFWEERRTYDFRVSPRSVIVGRFHARGWRWSHTKEEGNVHRPRETNDGRRGLHAGARRKRRPPSGKSIDTTCPRCVYIGVPAKKALQFLSERLQDGVAAKSCVLSCFSSGDLADYNRGSLLCCVLLIDQVNDYSSCFKIARLRPRLCSPEESYLAIRMIKVTLQFSRVRNINYNYNISNTFCATWSTLDFCPPTHLIIHMRSIKKKCY